MEENNEIDISLEEESNTPTTQKGIDPKSTLLPNKDIHSLDSAQRVNAGALFANEQSATLPKPPPAPPLPKVKQSGTESVAPLETYQSDIQKYIRDKNVSSITVAAAEQDRRAQSGEGIEVAPKPTAWRTSIWLQLAAGTAGILLIVGALAVFGYALIKDQTIPAARNPTAPFIAVEGSADVAFRPGDTRSVIMSAFSDAKNRVKLPLGLVGQLRPVLASSTGNIPLKAQTFLSVFTPNIPPQLLRTIQPQMLLGVHSLEVNQPFLMFSVDSYQGGYAGMLAWENTMRIDLLPLFEAHAPPHGQLITASSTPLITIIDNSFSDSVVENHDARVVKNNYGDILLLWTFIDRTTVLITTNVQTVHEIITRLKNAPTMSEPGLY
jgi:hypothetical protein